jgi:tetratricopeptide (TPR) repeat protein
MLEFLVVATIAGYIYYLRNYADLRSGAEKEADRLTVGIQLYREGKSLDALKYFSSRIEANPKSAIAYLYRARCHVANGDLLDAAADIEKGLAFDDTIFELHFEQGKLRFASENYLDAVKSLDKAIARSGGKDTESYHYRGLTHEKLGNHTEAMEDFAQESRLLESLAETPDHANVQDKKLLDRKLIANSLITLFTTALLIWVIKQADSIHLPYLLTVAASVSLGFVEPHRGWVLALTQSILLWLGYTFLTTKPMSGGQLELENFSLYGSIILTFAGSFLGAFLKRALNS